MSDSNGQTGQESILVTGGAGFIGSHLVDALLDQGHRVRVLDALAPQVHGAEAFASGKPRHLSPDAEFIQADITNEAALRQAIEGVTVIFHQAAEVGVAQSMYEAPRYTHANSFGTAVLWDILASGNHTVRKVVVASSMSIYGEGAYHCPVHSTIYPALRSDEQMQAREWNMRCPICGAEAQPMPTAENKPLAPTSIYAITKRDQEEISLVMGRSYNIPTVALRYFNVYGTRQSLSNPYTGIAAIFSARLLNDKAPIVFEDGNQGRDFVHVSDIVRANLLAMDSDAANYHAINIGTGTVTSVRTVAETIARGLNKPIEPEIVHQFRAGDVRDCYANIDRARELLGYEPQVDFEQGMGALLSWVETEQAVDHTEQAIAELAGRGLTL